MDNNEKSKDGYNSQKTVKVVENSDHEWWPKRLLEAAEHYQMGDQKFAVGLFEEAILEYNEALSRYSELQPARLNRAKAYKEIGEFEKAMLDYEKALEICGIVSSASTD